VLLRETPLRGAFVVDIEANRDLRGFFARTWCSQEFAAHGLQAEMVQTSISRNERRGTIRGMHTQLPPSREAKLVRCTRGAIHDVIIDMDPQSPSYLRHFGVELSADAYNALYIPPLMLHGFQTLQDECEVLYQMSDFHAPQLGYGVRWDDPAFAIAWPIRDSITILPRDAEYADFDEARYLRELEAARSHGGAARGAESAQ
jgi:dTDP-4-dehydrorhamnose 3,5-epimerase